MQQYKAVYYPDFPAESSNQRSVTIAFGKRTEELFALTKDLSSAELRQFLGTENYPVLAAAAEIEGLPLNTYCLKKLQDSLNALRENAAQLSLFGPAPEAQLFDPLSVTFRGGAQSPYVRWYPYLEGYSPQFVETIIEKYAPSAKTILDPFAGSGTTIFSASRLGKRAWYCEINPVLQFITGTRIQVHALAWDRRLRIAQELVRLAERISTAVAESSVDHSLQASYSEVFAESVYFDDAEFLSILKMRRVIDETALTEALLADLLTVAVLSSLVPSSRMKRAGDLRYKTEKELRTPATPFVQNVKQKLFEMSGDIRDDVESVKKIPTFISESAHSLAGIPPIGIDAVITSPPYVNGTNYFRNTKIELWFLRCLTSKSDLTGYRAAALTAGINDVTAASGLECSNAQVQAVVKELAVHAYDARIPRMVSTYFAELTNIFQSIAPHLNDNATIAIDIGDSAYAGVYVPADELLISCLRDIGFSQTDQIVLRQRRSRGGMALKQVLLLFRYDAPAESRALIQNRETVWSKEWESFKSRLPHQEQPFAKRNWGHKRHSVCSYMGKLKPSIAHHLVSTFVPTGGSLLDPFAGVGTIPFEAALQGKQSYCFDISPAALAISQAKLQPPQKQACVEWVERLESYLGENRPTQSECSEAATFGCNGKIAEYYEAQTLDEVLLARRFFQINPPQDADAAFVFASLLHILHGNRPYALSRRSHPITPYKPSGDFTYKSLIGKLNEKMQRGLADELPADFVPGQVYRQDAAGWWPRAIDQLDAVITSPPFYDSTRFYLANWLRLWFAGWSSRDFETQPLGYVDERQKKSFDVYLPILRQAKERLKPGGVLVLHLGKSPKADMAAELLKLGKHWFSHHDLLDESVAHCETHGIRDKGTVTSHQYLILY